MKRQAAFVGMLATSLLLGCGGLTANHSLPDTASQIAAAERSGYPLGTRDNPLRISSGVVAGNLEHQAIPVFPAIARQNKVNGAVVMKALIDDQGNVADVSVISGPEMLRQAYMDAVRQWKYKPYQLNGRSVFVTTTITLSLQFGG